MKQMGKTGEMRESTRFDKRLDYGSDARWYLVPFYGMLVSIYCSLGLGV